MNELHWTDANSVPELAGPRARLRQLLPADLDFLYAIATDLRTSHLWRYRGSTPSPERFQHDLWNGVLAQFVVEDIQTNRPVGHVVAYDAEPANHHCKVGVVTAAESRSTGVGVEAVVVLIGYLFQHWPLHKVYAEVPDFGLNQFASAVGRYLTEEGRLREHGYMRGRLYDLVVLAGYRHDWDAASAALLRASRPADVEFSMPPSLDHFVADLVDSLDLRSSNISGRTSVADLGLDSLGLAELREHLGRYGEEVPDGLLDAALTVSDLHHYASTVAQRRAEGA